MKRVLAVCAAVVLAVLGVGCDGCGENRVRTKYEIVAEYVPDTSTVTGAVKVEFVNDSDNTVEELKFNLFANAYRKDAVYKAVSASRAGAAYYAGESYGGTTVLSVNGGKSWSVGGVDENILTVELEETLYPNERVVVDIGFLTKLARVEHRTGVTRAGVNLGSFYPLLCGRKDGGFYECAYYADGDPFYIECADHKLTLTLPSGYVMAATADGVAVKGLESKKKHTVSATNVREIAVFASENYRVLKGEWGGVTLKYYYLNEDGATERFALMKDAFAYFSSAYGGYPYGEYAVAEAGFCYGGMEYPAISVVDCDLTGEDMAWAIVHETAHQWWYAAVGSDQTQNAWQDEGLAEYSTMRFFQKHGGYGIDGAAKADGALAAYREYCRVYGSVFGTLDTRMTRGLAEYLSEYEYRAIAYDKGAVLFDMLKKSVGEKKFAAALKAYYKANLFEIATPSDLVAAFERVGVDVAGLVDSFLSGKGVV